MDIKHEICDIRTWKKQLFLDIWSTNIDILDPLLHQCVETCSLKVFWLLYQPLPHLVGHHLRLSNVLERPPRPSCDPLYATNTSHRKQETFLYEYPLHWIILPTKKHNRTLLLGSILLKHSRHIDYWNHPLNMPMRACYLDCHKAGLCCYLVIHTGNLLHPLQIFNFQLWPINWLSLVQRIWKDNIMMNLRNNVV
jgi:hypothetical protein